MPEGWNWCKLEDAIQLDPKVTLTKERMKQFIPMSALSTASMVLDESQFTETTSNSGSKFQNGDTLLARITPCLENGKTAYVSGLKSDEGAVGSTEYIVMRAKTINSYMVYLLARTDDFRQSAINSMSGSDGRQRVKSDKLKMLDYLHPTSELVEKFENVEEPIFEKIYRLSVKMPRRNFLQILQDAKIDIKREYQRLFDLFYIQSAPDYNGRYQTLRQVCENNFLIVPFRGTCLSLNDFDDFYKYNFGREPWGFNLDYLLSFCEYSYNFIKWMSPQNPLCISGSASQQQFYLQQVKTVIEEIGYMETIEQNITLFVPKKQEAIAVSEIVAPEISYKVLEYNHYTMKGDIARKKETVRILADQLEPKRADLTAINKELASNVFFMFNNMNIRHNNSTEGDKNYREVVAKMTQDELENWYDETYQLCLLAFLELDNVERTKKVAQLKASFGK